MKSCELRSSAPDFVAPLDSDRPLRFEPWCLASYLAFRYVAKPGLGFVSSVVPRWPTLDEGVHGVRADPLEVEAALRQSLETRLAGKPCALFLSAGIDSAILAALLPKDTVAFAIRFRAPGAADESVGAQRFADRCGLKLRVIDVTWEDYRRHMRRLMETKGAPLHAVEVGLFKASRAARDAGLDQIVVGNGADSTFGGLDKLLSQDWSFDDFVRRYTFVDPQRYLRDAPDVNTVYEPYRTADSVDVERFLKEVHGAGIVQAFDNALAAAGCRAVAPYEDLRLSEPLDLPAIRKGESKPVLRSLFRRLYPGMDVPEKIAFARPMDLWLANYPGPRRPEFLPEGDRPAAASSPAEERWLLYCLEAFLDGLEEGAR